MNMNVRRRDLFKRDSGLYHMRINPILKKLILICGIFWISLAWNADAFAKIKGSGNPEEPYEGDEIASVGDSFLSGMYVKNFTYTDGVNIKIRADYDAKNLIVVLSAEGGTFADGTSEKKVDAKYGESLSEIFDIDTPIYQGKAFSGWYIKGNHRLASDEGEIKEAGDIGDCIHVPGVTSGYLLIDSDDDGDRQLSDIDQSSRIIAKALWRAVTLPDPEDGMEADDKTASEASKNLDVWDSENASNMAIEYLDSHPTKAEYAALYGKTKYQYGRALFCAETSGAESYSWYIKREADSDYSKLPDTRATLRLEGLKRTDNHAKIRCAVGFYENTEMIYETELTVFSLPKINGMKFSINGEEI